MKADTTRSTFKQAKHYNGVLMQQGRVQLDADWNEQIDITGHRVETETIDVIGRCGAPMHDSGFHIVADANDLSPEEKTLPENQSPQPVAKDLLISGGRYYVDGILCENDHIIAYTNQPDLPKLTVATAGTYLAYLDVWSRHITALEDSEIREVALGGPDTATRSKTIWQVKLCLVGDKDLVADCSSVFGPWNDEIAAGSGQLAAKAATSAPSNNPCIVAPGAGYRRLENQHYRVEVHDKGTLGTATFKFSRDNGSVVTKWESQSGAGGVDLTVSSIGRDKVLSFAAGQWVELIDDNNELLGTPGTLVRLAKVEGNVLTINPATATGATAIAGFPKNPRVRRWDMAALIKPTNQNWRDLEDGVQVQFTTGSFKTGDYWLIPARTASADVEWPIDPKTSLPATQYPFGIKHHYCRLAVAKNDGSKWTSITDCRNLFPPLTELINFFYVGGDGQEVMPDLTQPNVLTPALAQPLEAGVTDAIWPVKGAQVRFSISKGNGRLTGNNTQLIVPTGSNGVAGCTWSLDSVMQSQQVEAVLLDKFGNPICEPIHYTANLSVASQVAYDPKSCTSLQNQKTVQKAIETLAALASLYKVSGDDQSRALLETLDPLVVIAASKCGPIAGMKVTFTVKSGGGTLNTPQPVTTDAQGLAKCAWTLGSAAGAQVVEAVLQQGPNPTVPPVSVEFQAQVRMPAGADPGFQVTKILVPVPGAPPMALTNNLDLAFGLLAQGVQIECNDEPDPNALVSKHPADNPVCFVTVNVPFPFSPDAQTFYGMTPACFEPIILGGKAAVNQRVITWTPATQAMNWLTALFGQLKKSQAHLPLRILARLTLKGNFIWSQKNPTVLLDADLFADKSQNVLKLPSGDQRKGGTLDMWFWLTPPAGFTLDAQADSINDQRIIGTIKDNFGVGMVNQTISLLTPTGQTKTAKSDTGGNFSFSNLVARGDYAVSATVGNDTQTVDVTLGKP